jgi:catechol O-methyltransferase
MPRCSALTPKPTLELGTYCGSAQCGLRRRFEVFSVELSEANAKIAQRIWTHGGVADRITCHVVTISDGGRTLDALYTA